VFDRERDGQLLNAARGSVVYADMFDYPLTLEEVHRDLVGVAATTAETAHAVGTLLTVGRLAVDGPFLILPGRDGLAELRRERRERARRLWPAARRFGTIIAGLPFVRMVAVSGSLAAENPDARADLDYLIVTRPGRLWLVRALVVTLVRLARRAGVRLCPNYLLTTGALALPRHDVYTAHELLQAVPVAGFAVHRLMLERNRWAAHWLPNRYAAATPPYRSDARLWNTVRQGAEVALSGTLGDRIEAWEARRKQSRFKNEHGAARFTADVCEGHFGRSRQRALRDFEQRCRELGIALPVPLDQDDEQLSVPSDPGIATPRREHGAATYPGHLPGSQMSFPHAFPLSAPERGGGGEVPSPVGPR